MICGAPGCSRRARAKGLCDSHYRRARRGVATDEPLVPRMRGRVERLQAWARRWALAEERGLSPAGVEAAWRQLERAAVSLAWAKCVAHRARLDKRRHPGWGAKA